jgi:hypothetical protein
MKKIFIAIFSASLALLLGACEKPLGDKTDLSFIDVPVYDMEVIAFVPIQPAIKELVYPTDLMIGFDELLYVADQGANRIVCFDQSGKKLGSFTVPGVKAIAQNRSMEIIAIGTRDTVISGNTYKLDAIYRLSLQGGGSYGIQNAVIKKVITHPFYYTTAFTSSDSSVHLNRVSIMADNSYYITRSGSSSGISFDDVLVFNQSDKFITTVNVTTESGLISDYFHGPFAITTLSKPPQSPNVKRGGDFIFTSLSPQTAIRAQYITFETSEFGSSYYLNTSLAGSDTSKAEGFIYTPNRFSSPMGATIAGDGTNYIFVTDAQKDSVYLFTLTGLEGVQPPAGNSSTKNIKVSFGGTGAGPKQFNKPMAVAYHNKVLYVCDAGNGRITRFKLTLDFRN